MTISELGARSQVRKMASGRPTKGKRLTNTAMPSGSNLSRSLCLRRSPLGAWVYVALWQATSSAENPADRSSCQTCRTQRLAINTALVLRFACAVRTEGPAEMGRLRGRTGMRLRQGSNQEGARSEKLLRDNQ